MDAFSILLEKKNTFKEIFTYNTEKESAHTHDYYIVYWLRAFFTEFPDKGFSDSNSNSARKTKTQDIIHNWSFIYGLALFSVLQLFRSIRP